MGGYGSRSVVVGASQGSSKGATISPAKAMEAALAAPTNIEGISRASPRVVRSRVVVKISAMRTVKAAAPKTLLPADVGTLGVHVFHDLEHGLRGVDVVIMLRLQRERMSGALLPSASEYFQQYGLTAERLALAQPDAIVMHPGPINRGIEMDSAVVDGPRSVILEQVTNGIAVRMAVMAIVLGNRHPDITEET